MQLRMYDWGGGMNEKVTSLQFNLLLVVRPEQFHAFDNSKSFPGLFDDFDLFRFRCIFHV